MLILSASCLVLLWGNFAVFIFSSECALSSSLASERVGTAAWLRPLPARAVAQHTGPAAGAHCERCGSPPDALSFPQMLGLNLYEYTLTMVSLLDALNAALGAAVLFLVMSNRSPAELGLDVSGLGDSVSKNQEYKRGAFRTTDPRAKFKAIGQMKTGAKAFGAGVGAGAGAGAGAAAKAFGFGGTGLAAAAAAAHAADEKAEDEPDERQPLVPKPDEEV